MKTKIPTKKDSIQIIEVWLLDDRRPLENLTYFYRRPLTAGTIVEVSIGRQKKQAVIISSNDISKQKTSLKKASFQLKKIEKIIQENFLPPELIKTVTKIAQYYGCGGSVILNQIIPTNIWKNLKTITGPTTRIPQPNIKTKPNLKLKPIAIQEIDEERMTVYKNLTREQFAQKKSTIILLPTTQLVEETAGKIQKGLEDYTFIIHGNLNSKTLHQRWQKAENCRKPVLLITTPWHLGLNRSDWGMIIVEQENNDSYQTLRKPFVDGRLLAQTLAEIMSLKIIYGDILLTTDKIYQIGKNLIDPLRPIKYRFLTEAKTELVKLKEKNLKNPEERFSILSPSALSILTQGAGRDRSLILVGRKGWSPLVVCEDCGQLLLCSDCQKPELFTRPFGSDKPGELVCRHCQKKHPADSFCPHCRSWRLKPLGIGAEQVKNEYDKYFPGNHSLFMTGDNHTPLQAKKKIETFLDSPGRALIGTEFILNYLNEPVENIIIATLDAVLSVPNYKINEKIFKLIIKTRSLTTKNIIIQTRLPHSEILNQALNGNALDFYRDELADRQALNYPPFSKLLKIVCSDTVDKKRLLSVKTEKIPWPNYTYTGLSKSGKPILTLLIKLPPNIKPFEWQKIIAPLPLDCEILVDPNTIV
ncbi:MAG: hypothetical protein ACOCU8_00555 [Patescibacteria group bacterium]